MAYCSRPTEQYLAAVQVSSQIELAAQDCGQDPKCVCDWAGSPRECFFSYCCGTVKSNRNFAAQSGDFAPAFWPRWNTGVCISCTLSRHFTSSSIDCL